ncbi:MAG: LysM peptidoglycan-binding domain-containing protein [Ilumatobacter sp.]|nr:LysM peptidoglycan-binding domain-containing protein [Ilumatobacter sp.]
MTVIRRLAVVVTLGIGVGALTMPAITHAENEQTYVVAKGDTLIGIASKSGIRLSDLLRSNNLRLTSRILPGQELDISSSAGGTASSASTPTSSPAVRVGETYGVRWGDTLIGIARRHRISLASLVEVNQMSTTSLIMPGMQLSLPSGATSTSISPAPAPAPPSSLSSATHVVRAGDTLSGIASRYQVSLASFVKVNQMSSTSLIMPGMQLSLPSGATDKSGVSPAAPTSQQTITSSGSGATAVVNYALAQVGKPYRFFTKGPDAFDCSGLSLAAYQQIGIKLVHYSAWQARQGTSVDFRNQPIQPGDLIFQANRGSDTINHVGIAVTSTTWIHAVGTGIPVRVGPMPAMSTIAVVRRYVDSV